MEYFISHKRELNEYEKELLDFLFRKEKPEWLNLISKLKIIARCGCGECPTVLFGFSFDDLVRKNQTILIQYDGKDNNGNLVGVSLFGNNDMPTELEFYSIDGQVDVTSIPLIESLE
jgi:hypothetical protein